LDASRPGGLMSGSSGERTDAVEQLGVMTIRERLTGEQLVGGQVGATASRERTEQGDRGRIVCGDRRLQVRDRPGLVPEAVDEVVQDRKSTRLNSSHVSS